MGTVANAYYFYNRLITFDHERFATGKYYSGYGGRMVDIHHRNDDINYFTLYADSCVRACNIYNNEGEFLHISHLTGDDFELFSPVQVVKSGYIELDVNDEDLVKQTITKLYRYLDQFLFVHDDNKPRLCGGCFITDGLTDGFNYHSSNNIELQIRTIPSLCEENINRKHYGANAIPFIKRMDKKNSFHVSFIITIGKYKDSNEIEDKCKEALNELLRFMKEIDVGCVYYIERYMDRYVYL